MSAADALAKIAAEVNVCNNCKLHQRLPEFLVQAEREAAKQQPAAPAPAKPEEPDLEQMSMV